MVFNTGMDTTKNNASDIELIKALGGPTKVAGLLQYNKAAGGVQRVQNWLTRGIPSAVKLKFPEIFLRVSTTTFVKTINNSSGTDRRLTERRSKDSRPDDRRAKAI